MELEKGSTFAAKFKNAYSESVLNELGKTAGIVTGCGR